MFKVSIGIVVLMAILLTGCASILPGVARITGSGRTVERSYEYSDFTAIAAESAFKVTVVPGDRYLIDVTVDDNLVDYLDVTKEGDTLHIGFDNRRITSFSFVTAEARITMPDLRSVRLSGASQATIGNGFRQVSKFESNLSGASQLNGYVYATDMRLDGSGASSFTLKGQSSTLALVLSGASKANLSGLTLDKASAMLSGASNATLSPAQNLDYDLSGASHLQYGGSPSIGRARTSGASSASRQ